MKYRCGRSATPLAIDCGLLLLVIHSARSWKKHLPSPHLSPSRLTFSDLKNVLTGACGFCNVALG